MDTFIEDDSVWAKLRSETQEVYSERSVMRKIGLRASRVKTFFEHLLGQYSKLQEEAARRAIGKEWLGNPFVEAQGSFSTNLERVSRSAERNYGNGNSQSS